MNGRSPAPAGVQTAPSGGTTPATPASAAPAVVQLPGQAAAFLAVAPGVPFTGELLISDRGNHRLLLVGADGSVSWEFPSPGRTLPVTFGAPDDAFYTQDGRTVIANAEGSQTVTAVDVATSTVLWQVGHNGVRGTAPGYFSEPDDAVPSADGSIWVADIRNCRLVHLGSGGAWLGTIGGGGCRHDPPGSLDLPNGAFPAPDGSRVITEIGGSWVTWLNPDGTVRWSTRSPALYPSDAVPYPDGSVLLTDYSYPGAVYRIDSSGKVVWSYRPRGASSLDHPSIALPLAANRVAVCDDWGNKVLIVDPTTNTVVWTFTGQGSTRLSLPDGLDYLPVG
ncbi:MAG TPA: PQQ-binding-like beta-propeller repeat protein [Candidatus Binatia bacterium]|nr:PQQ-binding-like beta-propeller repeat protein [Candidatus Binatia bacterium]